MLPARPAATLATPTRFERDPAWRGRLTGLLLAVLLLWPMLSISQFSPQALLAAGNWTVMGHFLAAFLPPETSPEFLRLLLLATLETLAIATAGLALALLIAAPLTLRVTRALPRAPTAVARLLPLSLRGVMLLLRGIPELVWALMLVRVFGLGPAAGVFALGLTYGGMLAKVYAEILESVDQRPAQALTLAGAGRLSVFAYGLLPQAAAELTSYTLYRWECALRASVVMGFVGAGGLGQLMDQAMRLLNGGEAASILFVFLLLVLAVDALSAGLRRQLLQRACPLRRAGLGGQGLTVLALALFLPMLAAGWLQLPQPLSELMQPASWQAAGAFLAEFLSPELGLARMADVARAALETLAISATGTLLAGMLAIALALLLAYPGSGMGGAGVAALVRLLLNGLRSVPELVWATLTVLAVGLGPFAGALALALHTGGVLGRLFAEALQNASPLPRLALRELGCGRLAAFAYGTLPLVMSQWLAYALYRWEINIRMAAVLGFVGAGGLGQQLYLSLSLFQYDLAATLILAMLLLSVLVDAVSAAWRRRLA